MRRCCGIASSSVSQAIRPTNAQVPSNDSTAGSSSSAPTITMKTVTAAATAMPLKNVIRMTNRPSSAMITVAAANCTARPEVRTDSSAASRGVAAVDHRFAVPVDDEQRVVDADAEADHRGQDRRERGDVEEACDDRQGEAWSRA